MRYLIFGGTGSLGKKLIERLLPEEKVNVAVYSRDEAKHWTIKNELGDHENRRALEFFVGDVRDYSRVKDVIRQNRPGTIIIAAALKQVDTCELSPSEAIATNLTGTQNVVNAVNELGRDSGVEKVLFVSTDKACSPVNVYGMCKAVSERIVTSQVKTGLPCVKWLAVRYGNVLESRGSIIPLFKHQAEHGQFLTVTDPMMTRYVMTLDESVDLIKRALALGESGTMWIPKLPAMKIEDLAALFSERSGKPIKIIGPRPGEKVHEDLINESESVRTTEIGKCYVIGPASDVGREVPFTYSSNQSVMSKERLLGHLMKLEILDMPLDKFQGLTIEEIVTNRKE